MNAHTFPKASEPTVDDDGGKMGAMPSARAAAPSERSQQAVSGKASIAIAAHAYSPVCNCDNCFETWLTMPEPTPEERQAMAREFMALVAPSSGGELVTDWPKVSFPDLDLIAGENK